MGSIRNAADNVKSLAKSTSYTNTIKQTAKFAKRTKLIDVDPSSVGHMEFTSVLSRALNTF